MYVKPADRLIEGIPLVVRDPDLHDLLPAQGRNVPDTSYWHRRLRDGDVVLAEPPAVIVVTAGVDVQEDAVAVTVNTWSEDGKLLAAQPLNTVMAADLVADPKTTPAQRRSR